MLTWIKDHRLTPTHPGQDGPAEVGLPRDIFHLVCDHLVMNLNKAPLPELAYYYGSPGWCESQDSMDWIKSLLLFFDGLAVSYPSDSFEQIINNDLILAQPLVERGLLINYEPDEREPDEWRELQNWFDAKNPKKWSKGLTKVIKAMAATIKIAEAGALDTQESFKTVAQAIVAGELARGITSAAIQPVIDDEAMANFVSSILPSYAGVSSARVMAADMKVVGLHLSVIPLDEVLAFRKQYGAEYRSYAKNLRSFTLDLSLMSDENRPQAMRDRASELEDEAADLRRITRTAYKRSLIGLAFGIAGAAWTLSGGDPWGAALAGGAATAAFNVQDPKPVGFAYSYIFRARGELQR